MHQNQFIRAIQAFILASLLSACSLQGKTVKPAEQELQTVLQAYRSSVSAALQDNKQNWQSGRWGNILVNFDSGKQARGLCYHWQALVYNAIQPAIQHTRWRAVGIAINEGNMLEHHAVLIFSKARYRLEEILKTPYKSDVYVLDPWKSGRADVYSLEHWLSLPLTISAPPRLTQVVLDASI